MSYVASFFAESIKGGEPSRPFVIVDAQTGKILKKWEGLTTGGVGFGPGGNTKTGAYTWGGRRSLAHMDVAQTGSTCTMDNVDVKSVNLDGGTGSSTTAFSFACPTNTYRSVNGAYSPINDAHSFGAIVQKMYKAWTGSNALTFQLVMRVHYGTGYENAFWDGTQMNFGDGGSHFYPLVSADVSGHEISHGYTEQHSNLLYFGQSGGMNEAYSDMGGEAAEFYWKGHNDFVVGAEVVKGSGGLRYMCDPTRDGVSIDNAANFSSTLNVHHSSGVYNKAFCNLARTSGWNVRRAFQAFARANALYWTPSSTFDSGACGVQTAAADLGFKADAVTAAFASVGVSCTSSSVTPAYSVGGPLTKGTKVTDIAAPIGKSVMYTLTVPAGAGHLFFAQWGGLGDADLYVKYGSPPTDSSYDCRPYASGNGETCVFAEPLAGTYYVRIKAYASYSRVSLENNYAPAIPLNSGDGVVLAAQGGGALSPTYALAVPAGSGSITFKIWGGSGDADMYVQYQGTPGSASTLCVPDSSTNSETCKIDSPAAGTYYVNVRASPAYSDVNLKAAVQ
jgi:pseudolysin/vibriolysin